MESQPSSSNDLFENGPKTSGISIDWKRVLFRALRFWYLIVASLALGLTVAYLINRYTTRIYPVTASMIIREYAENADAKFLYNNPLVNTYRNYYNEPYIIRSYPLITSVVRKLNFHVRIVKEGDVKATEMYNKLPFTIQQVGREKRGVLSLEYIGKYEFECAGPEGDHKQTIRAQDTVTCRGIKFVITPTGDLSSLKGGKYRIEFRDPESVAGSYISRLKVSWAMPGSSVVNLDINGPIPEKEIDFMKALIEAYQRYDLDKKNQAAARSLTFIDDQLERTGDSLRMFESALESFKKKNFITDLSAEAQELYGQLKELGETRSTILFAANYYKYLEDYLRKNPNAYDQVVLPSTIGIQDAVLNSLVDQLIKFQTELNAMAALGQNNPMVVNKAAQLRGALEEVRVQILEAVRNVRATDRIKIEGVEKQIAQLEAKLTGLPGAERTLVNIQRNFTLSENLYLFLQQKRAEAGISKASTTTDVIPVNPPRQSSGAITPKVSQNYIIFALFGLLLPVGIFILIEVMNTKIQSREDIEKITDMPFLGGIGHKASDSNLVVYEKPKSFMAESFRSLRSSLNYFTAGKDHKVFMITSSVSGEGKTFTTINLATIFALSGKRTLIIGADLRKPKIYIDFANLTNDKGLSTYLSGLHDLDGVIQQTNVPHLDLISGGPVPPNPSELILNLRMDEMMKDLIARYDFVFIDTPPLALITDGLVLSKYADHTLYLVRQNYTSKALLNIVDELYRTSKLRNISIVLNDVHRTGPGYGYAYSYGYDYGYGYINYGKPRKGDGDYYQEN